MPVVFVPGITGSNLVDVETGRVAWGSGWRVLFPRDGGRALSLPLAPDAPAERSLAADGVLREVGLLFISRPVYRPLLETLEAGGYVEGDPERPGAGDTLFPFGYDWRRETQTTAAALDDLLERIARARGRPEVDLVCQSNAARICRWVAKYGGHDLDLQVEVAPGILPDGAPAPPTRSYRVARMVLVGASNGGAARTLRELDRGRRYLPAGRRMTPETLFSMPSLMGDLPADSSSLFVDEEGRPVDLDLYDASTWLARGWSIFGAASQRRLDPPRRRRRFGSQDDQLRALQRALDRARATHRWLASDARGFGDTTLYVIGNLSQRTPSRVVVRTRGRHRLAFAGDRSLRARTQLLEAISEPGDGHATRTSQQALSAQELAAVRETAEIDGGHFEVVLEPELHAALLRMLERPR